MKLMQEHTPITKKGKLRGYNKANWRKDNEPERGNREVVEVNRAKLNEKWERDDIGLCLYTWTAGVSLIFGDLRDKNEVVTELHRGPLRPSIASSFFFFLFSV